MNWIVIVVLLSAILSLAYYIVRGLTKKKYEYDDVILQMFVGDKVVSEMRGALFKPAAAQFPWWMNVVELPDGAHWTYMALQVRKTEAAVASIEEIVKELCEHYACEYLAIGNSTLGEFGESVPFAYTIYIRFRTTPTTAYYRVSDIITRLHEKGYLVQPIPFFMSYYGIKDAFGRYTSKPIMVYAEQPAVPQPVEQPVEQIVEKMVEEIKETPVPDETMLATGSVDMDLVDKFVSPALIGYHYHTGEPVYVDFGRERDAGFLVVGPTGSGKSYFAGYLAETAVLNRKARVIIIDPEGTHIGYCIENSIEQMTPDEVKALTYLTEKLNYAYSAAKLPTKVFFVGSKNENMPYDEIFRVNVSELSPAALKQIIKIEDAMSAAQEVFLRMIVKILGDRRKKYDLNDILEVTRDVMKNWRKYSKYVEEFLLVEKKEKGLGVYRNVARAMYRRIREINEKLPDIFVSEGGTDLKSAAAEGQVTVITFGTDVRNDDHLLAGIVDYIIHQVLSSFGPRAPEGAKLQKEGLYTLVVCEESRRYLWKGSPAEASFKVLVNEGRKYGIHTCLLATHIGYIESDVRGQLNLCKVVFRPDPSVHDEYLKLFTSAERNEIKNAFSLMLKENWPGAAIVSGAGVNTRKWVLCRLLPRRTLHRPKMDRAEWLARRQEDMLTGVVEGGEVFVGGEPTETVGEDILKKAKEVLDKLREKRYGKG